MKSVKIPENWSNEEAIVVYNFLADMMEAIRARYEDNMVTELWQEEDNPDDCPKPEDYLRPVGG